MVPARPGQLRTYLASPAGLRGYLLADLIRRVGERHRLLVTGWHPADGAGGGNGGGRELAADWAALNIHPLRPAAAPPAALDIGIGPQPAGAAGRWLAAGPLVLAGAAPAGHPGPVTGALADLGLDPLALRLAMLRQPYRQAVELTRDDLAAAGRLLRQWRGQVADWANSPSKPMCAQYAADITGAFDNDLDTPAALRTLTALAADSEHPPGSKFESFAYLDHLFGLDLARDIGR